VIPRAWPGFDAREVEMALNDFLETCLQLLKLVRCGSCEQVNIFFVNWILGATFDSGQHLQDLVYPIEVFR
jgi:hypothetical protein